MAKPRVSALGLPPRYRRHALSGLDALIVRTEGELAERLRAVERLAAAGKGTARAKAGQRTAEYRLALLRGSRGWLLAEVRMRRLPALAAGGLLLATSTAGVGRAVAGGGDVGGVTLAGSPLLSRGHPLVAQTPTTNPPGRDECRKLAADARARELDAEERDRLGLCLDQHRDGPGPAPAAPAGTDLPGRERQG